MAIFMFNFIYLLFKIESLMNILTEDTELGIIIKCTKSLRLFRILYELKCLQPLNYLIKGFTITIKQIYFYIFIIITYSITLGLIGS